MPMSARAYAALKAVAEWNPSTAKFLMHLLKDMPHVVKYKDDPYGPLTLVLIDDVVRKPIARKLSASARPPAFSYLDEAGTFAKRPPFPQEKLADCEVFGEEWRQRKFTKKDFADALEQVLSKLP